MKFDVDYIIHKELGSDFEYNPDFINWTHKEAIEAKMWPEDKKFLSKKELKKLWDSKYSKELEREQKKEERQKEKKNKAQASLKTDFKGKEPKNVKELFQMFKTYVEAQDLHVDFDAEEIEVPEVIKPKKAKKAKRK